MKAAPYTYVYIHIVNRATAKMRHKGTAKKRHKHEVPVVITTFKDVQTAWWMYLVPIMGQQQLITSVMRGEGMDLVGALTTVAVTVASALVIFAALTRLLRSERVVYGG